MGAPVAKHCEHEIVTFGVRAFILRALALRDCFLVVPRRIFEDLKKAISQFQKQTLSRFSFDIHLSNFESRIELFSRCPLIQIRNFNIRLSLGLAHIGKRLAFLRNVLNYSPFHPFLGACEHPET